MGYRAGIAFSAAKFLGKVADDPHIYCDACGQKFYLCYSRGLSKPPKWFLDGKAPPGWSGGRSGDCKRNDLCPKCKNVND